MRVIHSLNEMKAWSEAYVRQGRAVGLVPTMGYLHEGHLSLMRRARQENYVAVASIFVNPAQFGPNEDLSRYPRDPENDTQKCIEAGMDALFMPEPPDIYPSEYHTYVKVDEISEPLCGKSRPGHFQGVATVVLKLFNIVKPGSAYFGMKDFQQLQVIRTMVRDLNMDVRIVPCPTVREPDGLAMSSRNAYLSPEERRDALCVSRALKAAESLFLEGETSGLRMRSAMEAEIAEVQGANPDYISVVDPDTLRDVDEVGRTCLGILAVKIGKTRLIDNMLFTR